MADRIRPYDVVVFGASGFTGRFVVAECLYSFSHLDKPLKWAIAGRSTARLEGVLAELVERYIAVVGGVDTVPPKLEELMKLVDIIEADTTDEESLKRMCAKTKVLLNCVGPYRYLGEPVVKACVDCGTDYLDICGEPEFLERIELSYDEQARKQNCVIIGACGFDCVPADLGVQFARNRFVHPTVASSIETFFTVDAPKGYVGHLTTYECVVLGVGSTSELKKLRSKTSRPTQQRIGPKPGLRTGPFRDARLPGQYCFLFPGADAAVIRRTEDQLMLADGSHVSFYHGCYFHLSTWRNVSKMVFFGGIFQLLAKYEWGRNMLIKYPGVFSYGTFSEKGASLEQLLSASFCTQIFASGYSKTPANSAHPPDKHVKVTVKGPDPGYIGTSRMLVLLGLCVLLERSALPAGGVLTPGFSFAKTSAIDRLRMRGITFHVEE